MPGDREPTLRQALRQGVLQGAWSALGDPRAAEVLGRSGFDLVVIDLQHGFATEPDLAGLLGALALTPTYRVVRVAGNLPHQVMRCLDLGANGVLVPLVETADDATRAVAAARYAPAGRRSWGPLWGQLGRPLPEPAEGDAGAAVILMIETATGLANVDAIAAVEGVDALYVGPNDLALSLGLGRLHWRESEPLRAAAARVIDAGRAVRVPVGIDCQGHEAVAFWRERGASLFLTDRDLGLLAASARQAVAQWAAAPGPSD